MAQHSLRHMDSRKVAHSTTNLILYFFPRHLFLPIPSNPQQCSLIKTLSTLVPTSRERWIGFTRDKEAVSKTAYFDVIEPMIV